MLFPKVESDLKKKIDDLKMHIKLIEMQQEDLARLKEELFIYEDLHKYLVSEYSEFATPNELVEVFNSMREKLKERF